MAIRRLRAKGDLHLFGDDEPNPVIESGEICLDSITEELKVGDGETPWDELPAVGGRRETSGWMPSDYGWINWAYDPASIGSAASIDSFAGLMWTVAIPIRKATTITNLLLEIIIAGSGLTSGRCLAALYQDGDLLAATASQHTAWQSTGLKTMALTTPQEVDAGLVYIGFYYNGTTGPSIAAINNVHEGGMGIVSRFASDTEHLGLTTAAPAELGALAPHGISFWAGVS